MYLLFDLSEKNIIRLELFNNTAEKSFQREMPSRDLLNAVDIFLQESDVPLVNVKGIMVVVGAGSFTNTRISVVIANTIAFVNKIPVLGISKIESANPKALIHRLVEKPIGEYISATYSAEANITKPAGSSTDKYAN